jgi:hypothetical protein
MLVLDGSNSMWGRVDGTEKIVVAREVLSEVLSELPSDMEVGLAAYGHRREKACDDIEIMLPIGVHSRSDVDKAIRSVQPRGMTPITGALKMVAEGLGDEAGPTHLVLVSDGKETCDQDPCALVRTLRERGVELTVHVVGFDVTREEGEQLQCIAQAGGGLYADAGSADELTAALSNIRETVVEGVAESRTAAERTTPTDVDGPYWRLNTGEETYEGNLSFVNRAGSNLVVQFVNDDAVNVAMVFPADGATEQNIEDAFFAIERGEPCRIVTSDPPFQITLDPRAGDWLKGTFSGMLACRDYSALQVEGSFRIPSPGGE